MITIFWSVTPHSLIYRYRGFGAHHLSELEKLISQVESSHHTIKITDLCYTFWEHVQWVEC